MPANQYNPKEIQRTVAAIREAVKANTPEHKIRYTYRDFHAKLPHLFDAALNPAFDLKYLDMMLTHIKGAQEKRGDAKEEHFNKADEQIIGALREEYLDPLIANAPRTDTPQEPIIQVTNDGGNSASIVQN